MQTTAQSRIQVVKMHKDFPISDLKPFPRNPRHNLSAIDAVEKSLTAFGAVAPIVADESGRIAAGHTRYEAAIKAGLSTFPVVICKFPDENSFVGYNITDNQTATIADWDDNELAKLLTELGEDDFDLSVLAFDACEVDDILQRGGLGKERGCDQDDVPRVPVVPITQLGDLWLLGDHRLLCGDATKADDVARLMDGQKATLFATDPPYGVAYGVETGQGNRFGAITNDENDGPRLQAFLEDSFQAALPVLVDNAAWYLWHAQMTQGFFAAAAAAAAVIIHRQIIWVKPSLILGHGDYHWRHELCFYGWREGHRPPWYGDRKRTTVWEVSREGGEDHPTQKPVELYERPMMFNTQSGDCCYDPFLGSGTTIIAAEQLHRKCYGMEIEPKYVDVAVKRWEIFTGKKAVCHAS